MKERALKFFTPSRETSTFKNALKTLGETAVLWAVFLIGLPFLVAKVQVSLGLPTFEPGWGRWVAVVLFGLVGAVGLWCGWLLVTLGKGTPLPLDATRRLVIAGPYRVIRNPMSTLGIFQGLMSGWYLGSWPVMVYSLAGAVVWQLWAKPYEEEDLRRRFGPAYEDYGKTVFNWLPRLTAYPRTVQDEVPRQE